MKQAVSISTSLLMILSFTLFSGCTTPYHAPPAHFMTGNLPDPLAKNEGWAQVALGMGSGVGGEFGVTDDLAIQTDYTLLALGSLMGSAGVRYQLVRERFPVSLSVGGGLGVGGKSLPTGNTTLEEATLNPAPPGDSNLVGAGYTGLEIGWRVADWFGTYSESEVQLGGGDGPPNTLWLSQRLGLQFDTKHVHFIMEAGYGLFTNEAEYVQFPMLGLAIGGGWGKPHEQNADD